MYVYVDVYSHTHIYAWKMTQIMISMERNSYDSEARDCILLGLGLEAVLALVSGEN